MNKTLAGFYRFGLLLVCLLLSTSFLISGCASSTPIGVRKLDPQKVQRQLTTNVLTAGTLSAPSEQILNRCGLASEFKRKPKKVISKIHGGLVGVSESDRLYVLAELSFLFADKSGDRSYYLAAAVYAYGFLFPQDPSVIPGRFDPRTRVAVDLYNRGIVEGLTSSSGTEVTLQSGIHQLPFGKLFIHLDQSEFRWGSYKLARFKQAALLDVRGLRNRYRWSGIGAPLNAHIEPGEDTIDAAFALVDADTRDAVTILLRFDEVIDGLRRGNIQGNLELYTTDEATSVTIDGKEVPLEFELSSALAYSLEGSSFYKFELQGLLKGDLDFSVFRPLNAKRFRDDVILSAPYIPGRIPVVLIHGTKSSPARWAEMINELQNDRTLWGRYQFWLFTYTPGNPILFTGGILSEALRTVVAEFDPEGKDPALRRMVLIGHSQGGLLTKLQVIESGTRFWNNSFKISLEQLEISPETKKILERSLFYEPLPFVERVIFIATPHGGSYVAANWTGRFARRFISLSESVMEPLEELLIADAYTEAARSMKNVPKSIDNMEPENYFIKTLSSLPLSPDVTAHSIIAVKNPKDPRKKWKDGVVSYSSAHIEDVASELVDHSSHSTQSDPETIEEVRRILLEHLEIKNQ
jgi:triacylglycerol esterase/lipase EstA (alpha/beta hydrolase family)